MGNPATNPFRFDPKKATQAAGVILREEPRHRTGRMRLLRLLAIAERDSLRKSGGAIVGGRMVATWRGPIPGDMRDLMDGSRPGATCWSDFIAREGCRAALRQDPGVGELSRHEIEILQCAALRHARDGEQEMCKITRRFDEWIKNRPGRGAEREIPVRDALLAVGWDDAEADAILAEADAQARMHSFFDGLGGAPS